MTNEDAPKRESIRPRRLGWEARYADRPWFSRSKYASDRGHRRRARRARALARRTDRP